jgi:hypothetical protein
MKDLSLADLLALKEYLQDYNNDRKVSIWGALLASIDYELEERINRLLNKL